MSRGRPPTLSAKRFADPPYAKHPLDTEHIGKLFSSGLLLPRLDKDGLFYAEVAKATTTPEHPEWTLIDRRHYGSSAILLYQAALCPSD